MRARAVLIIAIGISAVALVDGAAQFASAASLTLTSQRFTPVQTCTVTGTPLTTTAVADTNARQATPATNFGTATTMSVSSGVGVNQRIYIQFSIASCAPAIPASATIRLATLRLFMTAVPAVCRTVDVFRVLAAWGETTLTWNNQPFGTAINNPASGTRTVAFTVGTPAGCTNQAAGYVNGGTVTTDVAAWVAAPATNFGWMLRDDVEDSATTRTATFSAKDLGTLAQAPQLVVTYVRVP